MRLTIPTTGSRGDVQPYVALGLGLQAAGHRVRLATHADFEPFVRSYGLDFHAIEADGRALQATDAGDRMLQAGTNPVVFLHHYLRLRAPLLRGMLRNCCDACRDADAVLLTTTAPLLGHSVAEKIGVPTFRTSLQPTAMSRCHPNFLLPEAPDWLPGRGLYNLGTHGLVGATMWQMWRPTFNAARADVLGLPPLPFFGPGGDFLKPTLALDGYSSLVVPKPPDWPATHHLTGYWFLGAPPGWQPAADLTAFLDAGPPPVCVGFGCNHNRDAGHVTEHVIRALRRVGVRGLLLTGWGGLEAPPRSDQFFPVESVPHDWLYPRMAAVVHHGGAGSTAAGLRAGVPSILVPFCSDQPFWARRVHRLGAGPKPIPRKLFCAERLERALRRAVGDGALRLRAAEIGRRIRAEDGVGRAVALFQRQIGATGPSTPPLADAA
ncbi:MAG TPA: glycosyltransferase [Gemmataceae bacterium]|nr:glycosyltransferase [Gemmataceae bacterium]